MNEISIVQGAELQQATPVWSLIIEKYLQNIDCKPKSLETYRKALKQFSLWISDYTGNARPPQKADIIAYKNYLIANHTASTVTLYIVAVKGLFKWLASEGQYPDITKDVKSKSKGQKEEFKRKCLSPEQVKTILNNLKGDSLEDLRDYALFNLLVRTGLRTIEIERADRADIKQDLGQYYLYIQGKGQDSKNSFVKLTPTAYEPLNKYLQARGKVDLTAPLFTSQSNKNNGGRLTTRSISRIIKNAMIKSGINQRELTAHSLRHTAITFSLLGGADPREAKEFARHKDINTTLIYVHTIDRNKGIPENCIDQYLSNF